VRQVIFELSLIGDAAIEVENRTFSAFFAKFVFSLIPQTIFKLVLPSPMLFSVLELPRVNSLRIFQSSLVLREVP